MNRPGRMAPSEFAEFLRMLATEVERDASAEGSVTWSWPGMGDWGPQVTPENEAKAQDEHVLFVRAFARNSNDMGQGGMWVVAEFEERDQPPLSPEQASNLRSQTIRERMSHDIARANPMLGTEAVEELADHAMFHVEHLLAEIEGLRHDNSTRSP